MSAQHEIVSIYTGRTGASCIVPNYKLFGIEHDICPASAKVMDGIPRLEGRFDNVFYKERSNGTYAARAVVADMEPSCVNEMRTNFKLMAPAQWVTGTKDSQMNFARGRYSMGDYLIDLMVDEVRKQAEVCDNLQGFMVHHSMGGGTGSGFTALVLEKLAEDYEKKTKLQFATYSTTTFQVAQEETLNAILHTHATSDLSDCVFMLDNSMMAQKLHQCSPGDEKPTLQQLNHVVAEVVSSTTSSLRSSLGHRLHQTLDDIVRNLVVLPQIRHPIVSLAPLSREEDCNNGKVRLDVIRLIVGCYSPKYALMDIDPRLGKIISCVWLFRGDVEQCDVKKSIHLVERNPDIVWSRYGDRGFFKWGIHPKSNSTLPDTLVPKVRRNLCMLQTNSATAGEVWDRLRQDYNKLMSNKTSVNSYLAEGMDEGEFAEAAEYLERIIKELDAVNVS